MKRASALVLPLCVLVAAGCRYERPIHPYRLEGWPGAPIEGDLFPLRDGRLWVFRDRLDGERPDLRLELVRAGQRWILRGRAAGEVEVRVAGDYLELLHEERLLERPLVLRGKVGRSWKAISGRAFVFGYDRITVLGNPCRALVVAIDREKTRDLLWFVDGIGWVRLRTERSGSPVHDAFLVEFRPGAPS